MTIADVVSAGPVVPVIVLQQEAQAVPLARALLAGGVRVLEVTLRTSAALACIRAIRAEVPEALVGAGTITRPAELHAAIEAGATFGVCPGATDSLIAAIRESGLPFLPGAMTPGEVMRLRDAGFAYQKLFPAQQAGGLGMLKALSSVFQDVKFCPTGGIDVATAPQFLALPNVVCVGGSWLVPQDRVAAGDWAAITQLAREAAALKRG